MSSHLGYRRCEEEEDDEGAQVIRLVAVAIMEEEAPLVPVYEKMPRSQVPTPLPQPAMGSLVAGRSAVISP